MYIMAFFWWDNRECKKFIRLLLEKKYAQNIKKINYAHGYQQEGKKMNKTNEQCLIIQTSDTETCKKYIETNQNCSFCIVLQ